MPCLTTREELSVLHETSREARDRSSDRRQRSREACEDARSLRLTGEQLLATGGIR
jgi:hypothetical protein